MSARSAAVLVSCAFALLAGACRSGEGEPCRCGGDCRTGLACFVEGEGEKRGDACAKAGVQGVCMVPLDNDDITGASDLPDMPVYDDLASRRDLAPGTGSDSVSGTTDSTTDATGTTTGTTTDATTGSTTGTTTGTTGTSTTDASTTDASTTGTSTTDASTTSTTDTSTTNTSTSSGGSTT